MQDQNNPAPTTNTATSAQADPSRQMMQKHMQERRFLLASREMFFFLLGTRLSPEQLVPRIGLTEAQNESLSRARTVAPHCWQEYVSQGKLCVLPEPDRGRMFSLEIDVTGNWVRAQFQLPLGPLVTEKPKSMPLKPLYESELIGRVGLRQIEELYRINGRTLVLCLGGSGEASPGFEAFSVLEIEHCVSALADAFDLTAQLTFDESASGEPDA